MNNKEGLKEIATRLPFVPTTSIGRKDFFVGWMILVIIGFMLSLASLLLLDKNAIFVFALISIISSYFATTWATKRFLDIMPKANAKTLQITLFVLIFVLNILTYIQSGIMEELTAHTDYIQVHGLYAGGAPEVSYFANMYSVPISITRTIIGIPFLLFVFFLFFKKGSGIKAVAEKNMETKSSPAPNNVKGVWIKYKKKFLVIFVVAFIIIGALTVVEYRNQSEQNELFCLQRINYRGSTIYRIEGEDFRNFKTQSEAMNYCLKVIRP